MLAVTLPLDRDLGLGAPGVPAGGDVRHRPSRSGSDEPRVSAVIGVASNATMAARRCAQTWMICVVGAASAGMEHFRALGTVPGCRPCIVTLEQGRGRSPCDWPSA